MNTKNELDDEITQKVRKEFKKVLSIEEFENTDSFLELGGDSFDMIELISNIEKEFNISVDIKDILIEPSVVGISEFIKITSCQEALQLT